jgi:hypothetical protein
MVSLTEVLAFIIEKGPGRTQRELAEAIFGKGAQPSRVRYELGILVRQNRRASRRWRSGRSIQVLPREDLSRPGSSSRFCAPPHFSSSIAR